MLNKPIQQKYNRHIMKEDFMSVEFFMYIKDMNNINVVFCQQESLNAKINEMIIYCYCKTLIHILHE